MPYEKSLDVESFKVIKEFGDSRITVGVYAYNNGEPKIQVVRENKLQSGEWRFAKLGRLSKKEAQEIIPVLMKAVESIAK
ncbi:MAG: hypothetical protein NUV91_06055 [Candidatus Omnitrophica bacterium]|nr:hypothetical protein [Candidatus Omnitrophota bacterium]